MMRSPSTVHPLSPAELSALRVPERTLHLLRDLVAARTGIFYDEMRLDVLRERLSPLAIERGFDSLLDYYYLLKYDTGDVAAWPKVMDALSVLETYFWREADQFHALAREIVPAIASARPGPIRIWSVPCATGEEPLSIAMALEEAGCFDRYRIEIHASDASGRALERAQQRRYGERAFRALPMAWRDKYFSRDGTSWRVRDSLYERVTSWTRMNIMDPVESAPLAGSDVVFCRNLFIYFTPDAIREVVSRLSAHMPRPGYLCVGSAESLLRLATSFELRDIGGAYVYVRS
jgi:chemotaxis protein methyltransferase CheR